mmetsp:Transcript_60231/g.189272  ORF Transcript_60231/g.189272 Transcript_60231/m.189272 type:complete len:314 (-) Transcript_60231:26-967(-)
MSSIDKLVPLPLLFAAHGFCSVSLTLLNKSIAASFAHPWTVVALQNYSTLILVPLLHLSGLHRMHALRRECWLHVAVNAVWLVLVLWSSMKTLEFVSVPLYVVVRNTVPFQTMAAEFLALGQPIGGFQVLSLGVTFCGTLLYKSGDATGDLRGITFAFLNTVLVSTLAVYERGLMVQVRKDLTPMMLNFYKVLFSMPLVLMMQFCLEGGPARYVELLAPERRWTACILAFSALLGFGVGTLVTCLVSRVAGTTVQVANIFYKFLTTLLSRFTHPSEVAMQGWAGYAICSAGFCMYTFGPKPGKSAPDKERKTA